MTTVSILQGRASLSEPTGSYRSWRITYRDPVTGKRRMTSGGKTRVLAEAKARQLLGDFVSDPERGIRPPTFDECFAAWMDMKESDLAEQTAANYRYVEQRFLSPVVGGKSITTVGLQTLRRVEVSTPYFRVMVRRLVRGVFTYAKEWTHRDPNLYAQAVPLKLSKRGKHSYRVERGDIPSSKLVASFIISAYSTLQLSPLDDPANASYDPDTASVRRKVHRMQFGAGLGLTLPTDDAFTNGVPFSVVYPKYQLPGQIKDDRLRYETRLAFMRRKGMLMRRVGLVSAIGAGGGLRIGEVLALRVRHVLSREQVMMGLQLEQPRVKRDWRGQINIVEQITRGGVGQLRLTSPKYGHERVVHLPMFLPNWNGFTPGSHRLQISQVISRFADESVSLWTASDQECRTLWRAGFCPLGWLMWQHLQELWDMMPRHGKPSLQEEIGMFMNMLLFPSVSRGIPSRNELAYERDWPYDTTIPKGTGGYQHPSNYMKLANVVYDYCAGIYDEWPLHRVNSPTRKGWSHHALRHYAASSRIQLGVPLTVIARELGHRDAGFTLERYGHMMSDAIGDQGFEY